MPSQIDHLRFPRRFLGLPPDAWIRVLAVLGVLGASTLIAITTPTTTQAVWLLLLITVAVGALIFILQPALGLLTLVATALLFPINGGPSDSINPPVVLIVTLLAIWLLDILLRHGPLGPVATPPMRILTAFCLVVILAFVAGQLPWFDINPAPLEAQLAGVGIFLLSAGAFWLAARYLGGIWLQRFTYLFLITASVLLALTLLPAGGAFRRFVSSGATGSLYWIWLVAVAAGQALFNKSLPDRWRVVLAMVVAIALFAGLRNLGWASGWFPALVALVLLLWLRVPRAGWLLVAVCAALFVLNLDAVLAVVTNQQSWLARQQAWQIALNTSRANPLLGLGPANYYFYVQQSTILGWGGAWNVTFSSHNNYVDIVAQIGIIGLVLFLAFTASMFIIGRRVFRNSEADFAKGYAAAAIAGIVGTLVAGMLGDWFLPFVYNVRITGMRASILFWLFLGGLLALYLHQSQVGSPRSTTGSKEAGF